MAYKVTMGIRRNRLHYAMLTAIVIIAGCCSRSDFSTNWPEFIVKYSGDTLWALMLFLGMGCLFPSGNSYTIALGVLAFAFAVEFSQLYHAAWIDSFRDTLLGTVTIGPRLAN